MLFFPLEQSFEEAFALGGLRFFLAKGVTGGGCQLGTGDFVAEVEVFFEGGHFQVLVGGGDGHGEGEVVPVGVGGAGEAELHEFAVDGLCLFLSVLTERRMVFPCRQITESVQIASLSCNDFLRKRSNHNAGDHICNCIACVYRCTYRNISCPMKKYFVCCGGYHLVLYFNLDVLR